MNFSTLLSKVTSAGHAFAVSGYAGNDMYEADQSVTPPAVDGARPKQPASL